MTTWVTRERPKIDRIACPWLIRRFIEPDATFLYVPTDRVFAVAKETGATPYDIPGADPFSHVGELCSFDAFIRHYELDDPALRNLAVIVRGADTARHDLAPQAAGGWPIAPRQRCCLTRSPQRAMLGMDVGQVGVGRGVPLHHQAPCRPRVATD
jgi:hypothetical protein